MTLIHILVFVIAALLVRWICPRRWRGWFLLGGSLLAVFWLQPSTPIRNIDFWLPVGSIVLTIFVWAIIHPEQGIHIPALVTSLLIVSGCILIAGATRLVPELCCLTPTRPPNLMQIGIALTSILVIFTLLYRFSPGSSWLPGAAIVLLIGIFIFLKSEPLSKIASSGLRSIHGQSISLASATDLPWLGFSYLAFRLIHVLRDFQSRKIPPVGLEEFTNYALFYPAVTAGPIDRLQRFLPEYRTIAVNKEMQNPNPIEENKGVNQARDLAASPAQADTVEGGERILFGIFKKFVLADSLAMISLSSQNAVQSTSTFWTWVMLYAFAFRLYFDFSGYTDVAIGIGRLVGIKLPENFDRPYLKPNLTAFWNSWHITLAQWFRAYYFNPVTRTLRSRYSRLPVWSVILFGQLSTMVLIGLWHGITWSFFAWGAWHGVGLFIHNRWSDWRRLKQSARSVVPRWSNLAAILGVILTFHFVLLGWVWFASPDLKTAAEVFRRLFGL
jgi:alginate O-acetyltransferase complex protein AlgI